MAEPGIWHGTHAVPEDQMMMMTIGPLVLSVAHHPDEWRIGWHRAEEPAQEVPASVSTPGPITDPDVDFTVQRFLTHGSGDTIRLGPLLADRPVVARPDLPLMVPAGDEATIFVSTPIWVRAELIDPDRTLLEVPAIRPSDTWFGPDTRRGVIAYASQTAARLHTDNLPPLAHRAITQVTVRNQAATVLALERLSVPTPNLTLFVDRGGGLWTSPLLAVRDSEKGPARVELSIDPPAEAVDAELIAGPREPTTRNVLSRAFHVLIG